MISVITINYNNKIGLENTIKSVINQTYKNFEYIIIDGDSSDGSKKVIEQYNGVFKYAVSEPDSGIYNAMNKGIKVSKGEYLLFLNSGDTLVDNEVLNKVSILMKDNLDIYYGNLNFNDKVKHNIFVPPNKIYFSFFYESSLPHPATFIKKTLFDTLGYYNENLKIVADWEFFMSAVCRYNATYLHIDYIISNFELNGVSCDPKNKKLIEEEREKSINNNFSIFIADAERLMIANKILNSNRFKMLKELENSTIAKKINSIVLRTLLLILRRKTLKDLD